VVRVSQDTRPAKAVAGTFAELARFRVNLLQVAEAFEKAYRMPGGMRAAGFLIDEDEAEGAGPEVAVGHMASPQRVSESRAQPSSRPAMETLAIRLRMAFSIY
jgi:hypothetical protein